MDRFHQMQVFVAVAESEGFAAGARRLQLSAPAVTRAIAGLEDDLGVKLLQRTTRSMRLTEAGQRYLEDARRILIEVAEADEVAVGNTGEPRGNLALTAPVIFGNVFVTPVIVEYLRRYPDTTVDARLVDRSVNLLDEGLDLGVRIGELADSSLRAIRVGAVRAVLVATPGYLDQVGRPDTPEDLSDHTLITSSAVSFGNNWRFSAPEGTRPVRIQPRLRVTSNSAAITAARQGFGITRVLSYQVAESVDRGELEYVLTNFETPRIPVSIVHQQGRNTSMKVRAFIDLLAERLRGHKQTLRTRGAGA